MLELKSCDLGAKHGRTATNEFEYSLLTDPRKIENRNVWADVRKKTSARRLAVVHIIPVSTINLMRRVTTVRVCGATASLLAFQR